jgi:hypothetical protein
MSAAAVSASAVALALLGLLTIGVTSTMTALGSLPGTARRRSAGSGSRGSSRGWSSSGPLARAGRAAGVARVARPRDGDRRGDRRGRGHGLRTAARHAVRGGGSARDPVDRGNDRLRGRHGVDRAARGRASLRDRPHRSAPASRSFGSPRRQAADEDGARRRHHDRRSRPYPWGVSPRGTASVAMYSRRAIRSLPTALAGDAQQGRSQDRSFVLHRVRRSGYGAMSSGTLCRTFTPAIAWRRLPPSL